MKFYFSIVSKDEKFTMMRESFDEFLENHPDSEIVCHPNNTRKITELFNEELNDSFNWGYDFSIMMHADVYIDLEKLIRHIEECSGKYDIMGLCGCEKISISESPLNWFCGSRKFPEGRWGCVTHGELNNHKSFFNYDRPGITDHGVSCIDGLCMIFSRKAIESGLRFDENLGFNCYDTQISLDAVMKFKLKLGVLVEQDLMHFSVGKSILEDKFFDDEIILRKRFGFEIPPGSRLEEYVSKKQKSV